MKTSSFKGSESVDEDAYRDRKVRCIGTVVLNGPNGGVGGLMPQTKDGIRNWRYKTDRESSDNGLLERFGFNRSPGFFLERVQFKWGRRGNSRLVLCNADLVAL